MKVCTVIEFAGEQYLTEDILKKVKEDWTAKGNKVKDLDAQIYVKPEEKMVYYVVNEETFSVSL